MPAPDTRGWRIGETLTSSNMIVYINNVLNYLAGKMGLVQIPDSIEILSGADGNKYFKLPGGTTAQRPSVPSAGMLRFNTTDSVFEYYNGSAWIEVGATPEAPTIPTNVMVIDDEVTHGEFDIQSSGHVRQVLGHDLGKPPRGFTLAVKIKTTPVGGWSVGEEITVPHSESFPTTGLKNYYHASMAQGSRTTAVARIYTNQFINLRTTRNENNTEVFIPVSNLRWVIRLFA